MLRWFFFIYHRPSISFLRPSTTSHFFLSIPFLSILSFDQKICLLSLPPLTLPSYIDTAPLPGPHGRRLSSGPLWRVYCSPWCLGPAVTGEYVKPGRWDGYQAGHHSPQHGGKCPLIAKYSHSNSLPACLAFPFSAFPFRHKRWNTPRSLCCLTFYVIIHPCLYESISLILLFCLSLYICLSFCLIFLRFSSILYLTDLLRLCQKYTFFIIAF